MIFSDNCSKPFIALTLVFSPALGSRKEVELKASSNLKLAAHHLHGFKDGDSDSWFLFSHCLQSSTGSVLKHKEN